MSTRDLECIVSELITFGYIRQHYDVTLPIVINKLVQKFYGIHFHWIIRSGKRLDEFLKLTHRQSMSSNKFTVHGIEFEMLVYPNGHMASADEYVAYFLSLNKVPDAIDYISLYLELTCEANGRVYRFKDIVKWTKADEDSNDGWYSQPKFSDCQNVNHLFFSCFIDFLCIKYRPQTRKRDVIKRITVPKHVKHHWIINEDELKILKKTHAKIAFTSCSFGRNAFCLECIPNGDRFMKVKRAALFIKLVALPFGVHKLEIECTLSRDDDIQTTQHFELGFGRTNAGVWIGEVIRNTYQKCMVLSVELDVKKVFDENDIEIDAKLWSKYGVE
eukprot:39860_1